MAEQTLGQKILPSLLGGPQIPFLLRTKICSNCKDTKLLGQFHKDKTHKDGVTSACAECRLKVSKNHYAANKAHIRDNGRITHLQRNYGITQIEYNNLVIEQGGVCAICGLPETAKLNNTTKRLSVDHCHKTGIVRGLLCGKCNNGIGRFEDNIDILASAISYLQNAEYKKTGS